LVQRSIILLFRLLGWLLASVAVILAIVLWRLASEPISLDRLTPYLQAALNPDDARLTVEVGRTQAQLTDGGIELVVLDVRGIGPSGEPVFALPEVEVDLSLRALFVRGMLAPVRLAADAPSMTLLRRRDGSIGLGGMVAAAPQAEGFDIGAMIATRLMAPAKTDQPLSYLEQVRLSGGEVTLEDRISGGRLSAQDAALVLSREPDGIGARLALVLDGGASVEAVAHHAADGERVGFEVRFAGLRAAEVADLLPPLPFALQGVDMAIEGRVSGDVALTGALSPLRFTARSADGVLNLPEHLAGPLAIDRLAAEGVLAPERKRVEIASLELGTQGVEAQGTAVVGWGEAGPSVSAELTAEHIEVADLPRLWPPAAGEGAREWVLENITAGGVSSAEVSVDLRAGDLDHQPLRQDAVSGRFDYRDLTVRYFEHLPPLAGISGSATFDGQSMSFRVDSGRYRELEVQDGAIEVTGIGIEGRYQTELEVEVVLEGPLPTALALIDRPPFGFASELGVDPGRTSGVTRTELRVGLPLYKEVKEEEVRIAAEAVLEDVAVAGLMGEVDVEDGAFTLGVDRERMELAGAATVRGVRLEVDWREYFADDAEVDRRYQLRGFLAEAQFAAVGLDALAVPLAGGLRFDVVGSQSDGRHRLDAMLDLTPLAVTVSDLDWRKRAGEPATLDLVLSLAEGEPVTVDSFSFQGAALEAAGALELARDPIALRRLALERFSLRKQQGAVVVEREGEALRVEIDAQSLDLDPLFEEDEEADGGLLGDGAPTPLTLKVRAERLLYRGEALADVSAEFERTPQGWRKGRASGSLPNGEKVDLVLEPQPEATALKLTSNDAGELLRLLDQTRRISGGEFQLKARISRQHPDLAAEGTLRIDDFTLLDAPILPRLLTLASLTGIANTLGGEGIAMKRLKLPFALDGGVLTLDGGRMSGSQLGLTMDGRIHLDEERFDLRGTIVPIYTLNWVIGKIPVIGDFLTGREGEGAFAFTFQVEGDFDDPDVSVNPLSILAPGFIRELFSGVTEGEVENPEVTTGGRR